MVARIFRTLIFSYYSRARPPFLKIVTIITKDVYRRYRSPDVQNGKSKFGVNVEIVIPREMSNAFSSNRANAKLSFPAYHIRVREETGTRNNFCINYAPRQVYTRTIKCTLLLEKKNNSIESRPIFED